MLMSSGSKNRNKTGKGGKRFEVEKITKKETEDRGTMCNYSDFPTINIILEAILGLLDRSLFHI